MHLIMRCKSEYEIGFYRTQHLTVVRKIWAGIGCSKACGNFFVIITYSDNRLVR